MNSDRPHLLIVDDEHFILNALRLYFESHDFDVSAASDGDQASEIFAQKHKAIDVAILDLVMPGTHGLELLRSFKEIAPDVQVIIATGCGSMGSAVEALRLGAFDFITKPILDFDTDLMRSVRNALEVRRSPEIPADPEPASSEDHWFQVYETLNQFAATYIGKPPTPKVLH
ncbi:MAG: response regulator, partial [Planctomycetota bacterium]